MIKNYSAKNRISANEIVIFSLLLCFAGALAFGKGYSYAVTNGIKLWAATLLPALFPYFFITAVLSGLSVTGRLSQKLSPVTRSLFRTNGITGYAFFISALSGYPVGAKTVADLKTSGLISETEAVRACSFCSSPSPMFLIASVGGLMFRDRTLGACVFFCNFLAVLTTGFLFSFYKRKERPSDNAESFSGANVSLYEATYSSVISILVVGGIIAIFTVLSEILKDAGAFTPIEAFIGLFTKNEAVKKGVASGIFECTAGLKELSLSGVNFCTLPIVAGICGFGGICVIIQSAAYLKSAKIKIAPFLVAKLIEAILSSVFGLILSLAFFK